MEGCLSKPWTKNMFCVLCLYDSVKISGELGEGLDPLRNKGPPGNAAAQKSLGQVSTPLDPACARTIKKQHTLTLNWRFILVFSLFGVQGSKIGGFWGLVRSFPGSILLAMTSRSPSTGDVIFTLLYYQ